MKVRTLTVVLALGLCVGVVGMAQVQKDSTAVFTVGTLIRLDVSPTTVDFGSLTEGDYDRSYKDWASSQLIQIWCNKPWTLTVVAKAAKWNYSGSEPNPNKPCSDLLWRATTTDGRVTEHVSSFTGLTTEATQVAAGTRGGNIQLTMNFRVLVSWENDPAGDYSLGFTYTLTAP